VLKLNFNYKSKKAHPHFVGFTKILGTKIFIRDDGNPKHGNSFLLLISSVGFRTQFFNFSCGWRLLVMWHKDRDEIRKIK